MKLFAVLMIVVGIIGTALGLGLLFAFPLKWAINYVFAPTVIKALFGVEQIGVVKAFFLSFITGTLFKSFSSK